MGRCLTLSLGKGAVPEYVLGGSIYCYRETHQRTQGIKEKSVISLGRDQKEGAVVSERGTYGATATRIILGLTSLAWKGNSPENRKMVTGER